MPQKLIIYNLWVFPTFNHTKIKFYSSTNDALEAQLHDLNNAKEFIFMEYHAIEDSKAWRQIEDILVEKVKQGVDVRVFMMIWEA